MYAKYTSYVSIRWNAERDATHWKFGCCVWAEAKPMATTFSDKAVRCHAKICISSPIHACCMHLLCTYEMNANDKYSMHWIKCARACVCLCVCACMRVFFRLYEWVCVRALYTKFSWFGCFFGRHRKFHAESETFNSKQQKNQISFFDKRQCPFFLQRYLSEEVKNLSI